MFDEKEFMKKLGEYEIKLVPKINNDEVNAILHYYQEDKEDGMYGAICDAFIVGCMKTEEYIINLIREHLHK